LVLTGLSALALWRALGQTRRRLESAAAETTQRLTSTERRLAAAAERAGAVDRSRIRLQNGMSQAAVLARALGEAWGMVGRVLAFLPGK
jgi:hypothetical protein